MVTAVLPTMSAAIDLDMAASNRTNGYTREQSVEPASSSAGNAYEDESPHAPSVSISSELTITPALYQSHSSQAAEAETEASINPPILDFVASSSKIAGYVGMFAGCGALLALVLFLPLPERFQKHGYSPESSLQYSYYIVAAVALSISLWCLFGLQGLHGERGTSISLLKRFRGSPTSDKDSEADQPTHLFENFQKAVSLGFRRADIGLGYVSGFVARASSVGISLFVPLLVNALFRSSGLCGSDNDDDDDIGGMPDLKKKCSQAYVLAAELTGVSQLIALLCAPVFGYASAKLGRRQGPLMFASVCGILGYGLLAARFKVDPDHQKGNAEAFLSMCLIGISQIGAIVCSLGILSGGVLRQHNDSTTDVSSTSTVPQSFDQEAQSRENTPLLAEARTSISKDLSQLKGSIAGVYSLYGGAGILILTKLGGLLFDRVSFGAPFYIMASFNVIQLLACIVVATSSLLKSKQAN